jgi:hypothetical protein
MKKAWAFASLLFLFLNENAFSWTITIDHETGNTSQWTEIDPRDCVVSITTNAAGIRSGSYGLSCVCNNSEQIELRKTITSTITSGGNIWVRVYVKLVSGFDWGSGFHKGIRMVVYGSTAGGYAGIVGENIQLLNEQPSARYYSDPSTDWPVDDSWHCFEYAVTNRRTASEYHRVWFDGDLIIEANHQSSYDVGSISLFDYFNNYNTSGTMYIDDVIITNEQPSKQDADGNYMIGPDDWEESETPSASGITFSGVTIGQ